MIEVEHLRKWYRVHRRDPGLRAALRSLFHRPTEEVKAVVDRLARVGRPFARHRASRPYLGRIRACRAVLCRRAMDLIGGKCVRLTQGDFSRETVYSDDPLETAKRFEGAGLKRLHMVDLDGARSGGHMDCPI